MSVQLMWRQILHETENEWFCFSTVESAPVVGFKGQVED